MPRKRGFFILMFKFGISSTQRLATCEPDLQHIFNFVIDHIDCSIICGHRDEADQTKAFVDKKSKVQFPNSKHNSYPSSAVDVAPYRGDRQPHIDWNDPEEFNRFASFVLGVAEMMYARGEISHKIRWGGDWDMDFDTKDNRFNDLPHFELIRG